MLLYQKTRFLLCNYANTHIVIVSQESSLREYLKVYASHERRVSGNMIARYVTLVDYNTTYF